MTEVDWLLDQFADALDERDEEIASLRARLAERGEGAAEAAPDDGTEHEERSGA
jgi:hypothetical protein